MDKENVKITIEGFGESPQAFFVPVDVAHNVQGLLTASRASQSEEDDEETYSLEEVLPHFADDRIRPARILQGSRYRREMTQKELAKKLGIKQHHLSEMENAKRPIGKEMAMRLAKALDVADYRVFL